jgi:hypothetical protein
MWFIGIITLVSVPNSLRRRFMFAYLISQALAWINTLISAQLHWISFPVREFPIATDLLFTNEYMFYPVIYGIYIIISHKKKFGARFMYAVFCSLIIILTEVFMILYSDLIRYDHTTWYWRWLNGLAATVLLSFIDQWFFKKSAFSKERRTTE